MAEWEDRFKAFRKKIDGDAEARKTYEAKAAENAAKIPQLRAYAHKVANEALVPVLQTINDTLTDQPLHPVITDHGKTITLVAFLGNVRIAVNLHLRLDGRLGISAFGGLKDTLAEVTASLETGNAELQKWFGKTVADYFDLPD